MQYKWLNKQENKNLIVFFNGWGMDEKVVQHLKFCDFDVLTFYDYRTFEIESFYNSGDCTIKYYREKN